MKTTSFLKLTMAITVLLLGIAIVSCENETTITETTKEFASQEIKAPSGIIPLEKAIQEYNNFYNNRVTPLKSQIPEEETRSVWFSKESLETYLDKIEKVSNEKGIDLSGINFVFATDKNNRQTLFIAPTIYMSEADYNKSFSINNGEVLYIDQIGDKLIIDSNIKTNNISESLLLQDKGIIGNLEALKMFNNYFETRVKPFRNIMEFDTKAVWYSIAEIRDYVKYVEAVTKSKGVTISGFDVKFSTYDNAQSLGIKTNKNTIFLLPTIYDTSNKKQQTITLIGEQVTFVDFGNKILNKNILENPNNSPETPLAFNHGQLNPPPPNGCCAANCGVICDPPPPSND